MFLQETKREYLGKKLGEFFEYINVSTLDGLLIIVLVLLVISLVETISNLKSGDKERVNKKIDFTDYEVIIAAILILLVYIVQKVLD